MNAKQMSKFVEDLSRAVAIAEVAPPVEDGGTCNLDSPAVSFKGFGEKTAQKLDRALRAHGLCCYRHSLFGDAILGVGARGQGNARTAFVETVARELKAMGYDARVNYVID